MRLADGDQGPQLVLRVPAKIEEVSPEDARNARVREDVRVTLQHLVAPEGHAIRAHGLGRSNRSPLWVVVPVMKSVPPVAVPERWLIQ
jgi:hypothetical protein